MIRQKYIGKLYALRGKTALTMEFHEAPQLVSGYPPLDPKKHLLAQFDEDIEIDGHKMHVGWKPFLKTDFEGEKDD